MHDLPIPATRPIFIVGSPRSGTSILTWCLGQHKNIIPQEESNWLAEFAIHLATLYEMGSNRKERSQLVALNIGREEFFTSFGEKINELILAHRAQQEKHSQLVAKADKSQAHPAFSISRSQDDPKLRWCDGTPEYSFYIWELKKLFPHAQFIHIVRDVKDVVNSMLNFRTDNGTRLFATEQDAYEYWLRAVQACLQAEQALDTQTIYRLHYSDLVERPSSAMRGVLSFLAEPFSEACIEPLAIRINSSQVDPTFRATDPRTDRATIKKALELNEKMSRATTSPRPSTQALKELEKRFNNRVSFMAQLNFQYGRLHLITDILRKHINWCGIILAFNLLMAIFAKALESALNKAATDRMDHLWLVIAAVCISIYVTIRRRGLNKLIVKLLRR